MAVAARGRLQMLELLFFSDRGDSDNCNETTADAIAEVIESNQLPALAWMWLHLQQAHPRLEAACEKRGIGMHGED